MISDNHEKALSTLVRRLEKPQILWALTGSMSFYLQGMNVDVHDIDIQTNEYGAYTIQNMLSDYLVRPISFSSTETIRSHFGEFEIDGISVEVMGDIQKFYNGAWENAVFLIPLIRHISFNGLSVPVLDLLYESQAYRKLGRIDKSDAIESFLKSTCFSSFLS